MALSEEALENKPKKPTNAYFLFMARLRNEQKGIKVSEIKDQYAALTSDEKEKLNGELKKAQEKFETDFADWKKKYKVTDEDLKNNKKSKSKAKGHADSDVETKAEKTKGDKKKSEKSKKEEKEDKEKSQEKKGKSKGKWFHLHIFSYFPEIGC